ncbi:glycoside hydrolase family 28 protein [Jiella mangrovi]|uniref:Glycoside hydrolase family 28 protein n=1 Tax=Jiella mangrovi TaxID=2821407 RepID=A0ABS4BGC5_9HYPH|nr:glycoside hydrolase family 28 protein [Jiella mangrovi]MBP0615808.1 glycoside hydrolase family 28 protein [Jiella mangrovi]
MPRSDFTLPALDGDRSAAIQAAIDADRPTRRVILEAGRHLCGGLRLRSGTELHLAEGAELVFQPNYEAYARNRVGVIAEDSDRAMIVASDATDVAITGSGQILGGGEHYHHGEDKGMGTLHPHALRPRVLVFENCRKVHLHGFRVANSPMWTLHLVDCDGVSVETIFVDNDRRMPNTDGLVLDGCRDVSVDRSIIRTADDGVVLKTSLRSGAGTTGACERIAVRNSTIESRSCALKIGTESHADFRDIVFEDCRIETSNRGLGIFSRDGGMIEGVRFSRIELDCRETPDGYWGSGEGLTLNVVDRRPAERPAGPIRDIVIEDISGRMDGAINLYAERAGGIEGVALKRIALRHQAGPLGTAQRYDLRPTPADLEPVAADGGRKNAWRKHSDGHVVGTIAYPGGMPSLFARGVRELSMSDVDIERPAPLPDRWNPRSIVIMPHDDP